MKKYSLAAKYSPVSAFPNKQMLIPILVSFIIPHKGRVDLLSKTLESILMQDFDRKQIEIILVTQEPALDLHEIVSKIDLKTIYCSSQETIAVLRNKGAEVAAGKYLAFIDADISLSSNWIETVLEELMAKSNRVLVSTKVACGDSPTSVEKIWLRINNEKIDKAVDSLHARNLFLSKKVFKKTGGFPEELTTCEDTYFTNKLSQMGEVYITPRAFHEHLGEDKTYSELFVKEIWRSQSNLHSIWGRKMPLKELPSIIFPFWEAFWSLGFIIAILLQKPFLILFSLLAFWGPIFLYSLRIYSKDLRELSLFDTLRFYLVYFVARMIGSIKGLFSR